MSMEDEYEKPEAADLSNKEWKCEECGSDNDGFDAECQWCPPEEDPGPRVDNPVKVKPQVVMLFGANGEFRSAVSSGVFMTAINTDKVDESGRCAQCGAGIVYDRDYGVIECDGYPPNSASKLESHLLLIVEPITVA